MESFWYFGPRRCRWAIGRKGLPVLPAKLARFCWLMSILLVNLKVAQLRPTLFEYSPWNSPGQNTGVGSVSRLQGIFPTQGSNLGLPHCGQILYNLSHKGSPRILEWVAYPFSSRSSRPRNPTGVSCIAGGFFTKTELSGKLRERCHFSLQDISFC